MVRELAPTEHTRAVPLAGTDKTCQIPLTKGLFAVVDADDLDLVRKYSWHAMRRRQSSDYQASRIVWTPTKQRILMHRFILGITDRFAIVDHIDHDPLNNRRSNLRLCTIAQNCRNSRKRNPHQASSQYKGVYLHKRRNVWRAGIVVDRKRISLGEFQEELDAALAYDSAAIRYFGEFANVNFRKSA